MNFKKYIAFLAVWLVGFGLMAQGDTMATTDPTTAVKKADGFDPTALLPQSRYEPQQMFDELQAIVRERITDPSLRALVEKILADHRE